ncbi:hypothetical protein [Actinomyces sp. zg328]|uniref:hypothetical protein n=1 Tax=Actinomyces sp. zg328 TaxID=2609287 RepID=UPI002E2DAF9D|nr:hypothetical protein [Actinomyces sp. zg328]
MAHDRAYHRNEGGHRSGGARGDRHGFGARGGDRFDGGRQQRRSYRSDERSGSYRDGGHGDGSERRSSYRSGDDRRDGRRGSYRSGEDRSGDDRRDGRRGSYRSGEDRYGDGGYRDGGRGSYRSGEDRYGDGGYRDRGYGERPERGDRSDRRPHRFGDDRRAGAGGSRDGRFGGDRRYGRPVAGGARAPQRNRVPEPRVPDDVQPAQLDASARRELRALGRANAENVAKHLVMVQRLLDTDPAAAYEHARYAASHAGRIAVVREAAGIAAYLSEHFSDALRDIRAARRLSGLDLHRAIEADCERALGRYNQALKAAAEADPKQLDDVEEAEIAMVVSGVRHEMGQDELGLVVVEDAIRLFRGDRETLRRLHSVRADRLENLGRGQEADAIRERIGEAPEAAEPDVEVYDVEEESEEERAAQAAATDEPESADGPEQEESLAEAPTDDIDATEDSDPGDVVDRASERAPEGPSAPRGADAIEDELIEHLQSHGIPADAGTCAAQDSDGAHGEEAQA